jgi:hypothetical protein
MLSLFAELADSHPLSVCYRRLLAATLYWGGGFARAAA